MSDEKKPRKPRKPVTMGEVRIARVYKANEQGNCNLDGQVAGATILVLQPPEFTSAQEAMLAIANRVGDHAVIRLVGSRSVTEIQEPTLVQSALQL